MDDRSLPPATAQVVAFNHLRILIGVTDILAGGVLTAIAGYNHAPVWMIVMALPIVAGILILWRQAWGYWLGAIIGVLVQVVGTVGLLLGFFGWGEQQGDWGPLLVLGGLLFVAGGLQWRGLQRSRSTFHMRPSPVTQAEPRPSVVPRGGLRRLLWLIFLGVMVLVSAELFHLLLQAEPPDGHGIFAQVVYVGALAFVGLMIIVWLVALVEVFRGEI